MRNELIIAGVCGGILVLGGVLYYFSMRASVPAAQPVSNAGLVAPSEKEITFKVLDQGAGASEIAARKNYAFYNAEAFATFWKKVHGEKGKPVPNVDFNKNYVIGVFAGEKPPAAAISVTRIVEEGDKRSVAIRIAEPKEDCASKSKANPYEFIVVPVSDHTGLSHTDERTKVGCD